MKCTERASAQALIHRIELDGEYDLSRKEELLSAFATLSADGPATIDLSRVTYMDSTVLNALALLHLRLSEYGVTLVGPTASMRRLLSIVKFEQFFRIVDA